MASSWSVASRDEVIVTTARTARYVKLHSLDAIFFWQTRRKAGTQSFRSNGSDEPTTAGLPAGRSARYSGSRSLLPAKRYVPTAARRFLGAMRLRARFSRTTVMIQIRSLVAGCAALLLASGALAANKPHVSAAGRHEHRRTAQLRRSGLSSEARQARLRGDQLLAGLGQDARHDPGTGRAQHQGAQPRHEDLPLSDQHGRGRQQCVVRPSQDQDRSDALVGIPRRRGAAAASNRPSARPRTSRSTSSTRRSSRRATAAAISTGNGMHAGSCRTYVKPNPSIAGVFEDAVFWKPRMDADWNRDGVIDPQGQPRMRASGCAKAIGSASR